MDRPFGTFVPAVTTEFAGKRAIVTGIRGIRAAVVQRLLDGSATVVITARNATDETPTAATY